MAENVLETARQLLVEQIHQFNKHLKDPGSTRTGAGIEGNYTLSQYVNHLRLAKEAAEHISGIERLLLSKKDSRESC